MANLNETLKELNKKFKTGEIKIGVKFTEHEKIPFTSTRLNYMTYGGLPTGRIIEFSGAEGSGKTTTALDIVAQAQKQFPDKQVAFVDVECTFDPHWAKLFGVDVDSLIYYQIDSQNAGQVLQSIFKLMECKDVSLCVLDSIAGLVSEQQVDREIGEKTYAGVSAELTVFSNKVKNVLSRNGNTLIAINQLRDDLGNPYGGTKTVGGRAWKHNCSVRLFFRKGNFIDDKGNKLSKQSENPVGNIVQVHLEKSKVDKSNRRIAEYTLNYMTGIDELSDIVDVAVKFNIIDQSGAWYYITYKEQEVKYQGKNKLKQALEEDKELLAYIQSEIDVQIKQ